MLALLLCAAAASAQVDVAALTSRLQAVAEDRAKAYSCKIAIGVQTATQSLSAASDGQDSERYVWGSVTKLLTGSGVLRAAERKQLDLDKPVAVRTSPYQSCPRPLTHSPCLLALVLLQPLLDPMLASLKLGSMEDLFGSSARLITPRHLGSMKSGVPDYDTAKPYPRPPTDAFRAEVYAKPDVEWDPADILNVSWVAKGELDFAPGTHTSYSSTNFVLLGLLLAALNKSPKWDAYDQLSALDALPDDRRKLYDHVRLGVHGAPSALTSIHGYDRTSYNGANASRLPGTDVFKVKGVYAGWTASDVTASVADVARLAYDIFGAKGPRILTPSSVATMVPHNSAHSFPYGFATFNLSRGWGVSAGKRPNYNTAYGHLGATYGYQSIALYFPAADLSLAVASNIETDDQVQPSDVACLAYNVVLAAIKNWTQPTCKFVTSGYYGGKCDCGNDYECKPLTKKCERSSRSGKLSKADCEASC